MIFSELYGAYYNTVAAILAKAVEAPIKEDILEEIIRKYAFSESIWEISDAIKQERWQFIRADGTTPIVHKPEMPLTILQQRWLKALIHDPRIKLFGACDFKDLDVEPLFLPEDYIVFDKCSDGDNYEDETYISNFRLILDAIKKKYSLKIRALDRKGNLKCHLVLPKCLEYSQKDDKFRLLSEGDRFSRTINLGRILCCQPYEKFFEIKDTVGNDASARELVLELKDERNALERVLLHFAHFEKTVERVGENRYSMKVRYDEEDEREMVIRVLSFGPMVKVTAPIQFIDLIRQRLMRQKSCEH